MSKSSNVISLNALGPDRSPGLRLIGDCREQLSAGLTRWLGDVAPTIAEELFLLADGTRDRLTQTRYLDLRQDIEKEWSHLVDAFRRALLAQSDPRPATTAAPLEVPDFAGLQLVDDDELAERIVVREFAAQLAESCDTELYGLNRRMALLLGSDDPDIAHNPLAPSVICKALAEACAALGADAENRLLLMRRLERHLHLALLPLYAEINSRLIGCGILPDLKRSYRRASGGTAGDAGGSGAESGTGGGDLLGALQRIIAARVSPPGTAPEGATGATPPAGGVAGVPADAAALSHAFLASLDVLQHQAAPATSSSVNLVRQVRDSESARGIGHVEAVTIDIVAMLFDFIFDDSDIAPAIKALISRLQIPVLKTAMLDHSFFSDRQHPARRFLDEISGIATRWGERVDASDPCYTKLGEVVERIQNEFADDVGVFAAALAELEAFIHESDTRAEEATVGVAAEHAAEREREAAAHARADTEIASLLMQARPEAVRAFVAGAWRNVLRLEALRHEPESAGWQEACDVMPQLFWSIEPKHTQDERLRLIGMLPTLLARINRGLDLALIDAEQRRPFFDALVELHAAALKGIDAPAAPAAAAEADRGAPAEREAEDARGDLLVMRSVERGIVVEEVMLVGASPAQSGDQDALRTVGTLQRGDWIEFSDDDGVVSRERLTWVSPQRGILVFSNHRAAKAISFTPEALARRLADGSARRVAEQPIFERAMSGVLAQLNAA